MITLKNLSIVCYKISIYKISIIIDKFHNQETLKNKVLKATFL
jgi:hypothetical protein